MFSTTGALALTLALAAQTPATPPPSPAPDPPRDRPIVELFQNLGRDFVRLPSLDSATIAMAGSGAALVAHRADDNLRTWGDERGPAGYSALGRVGGAGWLQGSAAIATYAVGLVKHHELTTHVGSDLIRAQALNGLVTRVIKIAANRQRPSGSHDSLPSGHASASFATAAVLGGHFGWRASVPAYAGASFIAWTRVRDRAHWLSDVIVGAAVGTIVGRTVTAGHRERRWTIVPTAGRGRVGVVVMRNATAGR